MVRLRYESLHFVIAVVLMLGIGAPAWAQSTGTVQGIVTDTQDGVMPGVSVVLRNTATGVECPAA
jgi:hypothetical protein